MTPTITPIYAAILAVLFIVLSFAIIRVRRGEKISLGDGKNPVLQARTRAHGNFAEYVPFALLLMLMAELQGGGAWLIHGLGLALVAGRLAHAWGLTREPMDFRGRVGGMVLTFSVLAVGALACLALALV